MEKKHIANEKWLLAHLENELQGFNKKDIKKLMMALSVEEIKKEILKDKKRSELRFYNICGGQE